MQATLLFPHQLFQVSKNSALGEEREVFLVEDPLFFGDQEYYFKFHKQKLVLHRASMQEYKQRLKKKGFDVNYIEYVDINSSEDIYKQLSQEVERLHLCEPVDYILEKRIRKYSDKYNLDLKWYESPNFINTKEELKGYFADNDFFQTKFYKQQRKKLDILLQDGEPEGGDWTYDKDNRKKLPKDMEIPDRVEHSKKKSAEEAIKYVEKNFPNHPGKAENFNYSVTRRQALTDLRSFLENKLNNFGPYQDAISQKDDYLFHSVLSASINIGLLNPLEVAKRAEEYYRENDVKLQSVEGFIRQIIGWREFMRAVYEFKGVEQRSSNYFNHKRKIGDKWYTADTGVGPIDDTIEKINQTAYGHHIERLMVLGNFMLLCEIDPEEVYKWFMEIFIDSYDWVMVPNVYGMSQYADGGDMVTKPYISSSNYIRKMSDYDKGDWCEIWDGLYWRFIDKHKEEFENNPRMSFMTSLLDRMGGEKLKKHKRVANNYLKNL